MNIITEGLRYRDLKGYVKPRLHIDEFVSKIGTDDNYIVLSFYVKSENVGKDLAEWFDRGYSYVFDADVSSGEIESNRFLVFVELLRRSRVVDQIHELLDDLTTLCGCTVDEWTLVYKNERFNYDAEKLKELLPLSPRRYRRERDKSINDLKTASGLSVKSEFDDSPELTDLRVQAGLI